MEKREILNRPSVQHVAANIRLTPNGHSFVFKFICRCDVALVRFDVVVSVLLAIVLCGVDLICRMHRKK